MTDLRTPPEGIADIAQRHPLKLTGSALLVAALAIAAPLVGGFEGKRNVGYYDIVHVPTYCYGGTGKAAVVGKRYSDAVCQSQLATDVREHAEAIAPCVKVATPAVTFAAFVSFSYNVGAHGFCRSSVARDLNAGNLRQACADLSKFVYAGGKPVKGLVNRRAAERALCEEGLK